MPIFKFLLGSLISSMGKSVFLTSDILSFLGTWQGIVSVFLIIFLLCLIIAFDINTFIIISSKEIEGYENIKIRNILALSFKSIRKFFTLPGLLILLFIGAIFPLLGLGASIPLFENIRIPNFVTSVIFNTPLYSAIYFVGTLILLALNIMCIFTLHYMIIEGIGVTKSIKKSRTLVKKHFKNFIIDYFWSLIKIAIIYFIISIIIVALQFAVIFFFKGVLGRGDLILITVSLVILELVSFAGFMAVPTGVYLLTK